MVLVMLVSTLSYQWTPFVVSLVSCCQDVTFWISWNYSFLNIIRNCSVLICIYPTARNSTSWRHHRTFCEVCQVWALEYSVLQNFKGLQFLVLTVSGSKLVWGLFFSIFGQNVIMHQLLKDLLICWRCCCPSKTINAG